MVAAVQTKTFYVDDRIKRESAEIVRPAFKNSRVRLQWCESHWFKRLQQRLNALTSLAPGWDGYRGKPVSFTCAMFAAQLLERVCNEKVPAPSLVPGSDGSIQIEWHINGYDIEIDVLAPFEVVASRFDTHTENDEQEELQDDFTLIARWVSELAAERSPVATAKS